MKDDDLKKVDDEIVDEEKNIEDTSSNEKKISKEIEIVDGNGSLNISPVYEHLEIEKPKPKEKKNIIIPEEKK